MADGASGAEWLTIAQATQLLGFKSEKTVYRLAQRGELPGAKKFGGGWRVRRSELERTDNTEQPRHAIQTIRVGKA